MPPAVQRHRRRVRAARGRCGVHLEDGVLGRGFRASVCEHHVHRRQPLAGVVRTRAPISRRSCGAFERSGCTAGPRARHPEAPGLAEHGVQHRARCRPCPGAPRGRSPTRDLGRAEPVQQPDHPIAAEVGGVSQRRAPVAVLPDQRLLVDQLRVGRSTSRAPSRGRRPRWRSPASPPGPAAASSAPGTCARAPAGRRPSSVPTGVHRVRVVFAKLRGGLGVSRLGGAEQIHGLVLQLVEVRADRQAANGHGESLASCFSCSRASA